MMIAKQEDCNKMSNFIRVVVAAGVLAMVTASSAAATTGPAMLGTNGTVGTGSNTAAISGGGASYGAWTTTSGGAVYSCADVTYRFTAITTGTATVDPTFAGCKLTLSGTVLGTFTIDTPCTWTLSVDTGTFNNTTGAEAGGTLITGCVTQMTIPSMGCTVDIAAQSVEGLSMQNIDATGANSTAAVPWGSKIVAALSGLTYTATGSCLIAEHGTMSVSSTVAVRNLYGQL
jgi:hypothetical protein